MTLDEIMRTAIEPALALLPASMDSRQARLELLNIGLQESRFLYRRQVNGPARGFWQFEQGGGCRGVVAHPAARAPMRAVCKARGVEFGVGSIYSNLDIDDVLAAGAARVLLFTDPAPLPDYDDAQGGWDLYVRVWRPGHPRRESWDAFRMQAREALGLG